MLVRFAISTEVVANGDRKRAASDALGCRSLPQRCSENHARFRCRYSSLSHRESRPLRAGEGPFVRLFSKPFAPQRL